MSTQTKPAKKSADCQRCVQYEQQWEKGPHTLRLRFWHWHTAWCPGYKSRRQSQKAAASKQAKK